MRPIAATLLSPRLRSWLASRRAPLVIIVVCLLLCAPSLTNGVLLDDHVHRLIVQTEGPSVVSPHGHAPWDVFRFYDGSEETWRHGLETGITPWFADPNTKLAFFRPLSGLTHWFDYAVLDQWPVLMHVHSLVWVVAMGVACLRLLRVLRPHFDASQLPAWTPSLILFLYLCDAGHGTPIGWLSNRNQLLSVVFGALALAEHVQGRRADGGGLRHAVAGPALFLVALLSAESGLGWLGFLIAYALTLDNGGIKRGLLSISPYLVVVVVWRVVYVALGYGTAQSGLYVDPLSNPIRFIIAVTERLPQLLGGQWGGPPAGVAALLGPEAERAAIGISVVVVALSIFVGRRALRRSALARFWLAAAVLSAVPFCATTAAARLMLIPGFGALAFVAHVIADVVEPSEGTPSRAERWGALAWLISLGILTPLRMPVEARGMIALAYPSHLAIDSAPPPPNDASQTLVIVAVPDPIFMCGHLPAVRASRGVPYAPQRCLGGLEGSGSLTRVDERTLDVRFEPGLLNTFFSSLMRPPDTQFERDWSLALSDVRYRIVDWKEDGSPRTLRAEFTEKLESDSYRFVVWSPEDNALVDFNLPAPGETVELKGEPMADLIMSAP